MKTKPGPSKEVSVLTVLDVHQLAGLLKTTAECIYSRRWSKTSLPAPFQTRPLLWTLKSVECWIAACELENRSTHRAQKPASASKVKQRVAKAANVVIREVIKDGKVRNRDNSGPQRESR